MSKKLNPNEAPTGYVAVAHYGCTGCAFEPLDDCAPTRAASGCTTKRRKDGHSVIFIRRETAPAEPAPLDARITIRVPKATKAKAQRIGAAAVIAAIDAVQEGGAA